MGEDATYEYILRQQLIRNPVLLEDVIVNTRPRQRAAEEESKQPISPLASIPQFVLHSFSLHLPHPSGSSSSSSTSPSHCTSLTASATRGTRDPRSARKEKHSPPTESTNRLPNRQRTPLLRPPRARLKRTRASRRRCCCCRNATKRSGCECARRHLTTSGSFSRASILFQIGVGAASEVFCRYAVLYKK